MHQLATGATGPHGLVGSEPPVSTETIGRAPSIFDAAVPLRSLEELVGLKGRTSPIAAKLASPIAESLPPAVLVDRRRVVVRLLGGEDVQLGAFDDADEAVDRAKELVATLAAAEIAGEWPEVEGRFLRPASIVSVDVLVAND